MSATAPWKPGQSVDLETERFRLQSMTRLQATLRTYPWTFDPEVMHPFGLNAGTWSRRSWYFQFRSFNNRRKFCLAITPKDQTQLIGYEQVEIRPRGVALLATVIGDRTWWGKGVVRESRSAAIDFLFDRLGCNRVWGTPAVRNLPSVFNYRSLGFTCEGVMRQHKYDPATWKLQDYFVFGMLRDEWLARRKQQEDA